MQPNNKAKAIATVGDNGQPWNTSVASFHFDNDYALFWASWQENQHSKNIRSNSKAFIIVYDSTPADGNPSSGIYMQGQALELTNEEQVMQAALVFKDDPYNPSDGKQYLCDFPRRIYKFVPEKIWMNGDEKVNGNFVDVHRKAEVSTNLRGDIIEESLADKATLKTVNITDTRVEPITPEHKTPWLKQWTLNTIEVPEYEAEQLAEQLSHAIENIHGTHWYIDFKNETTHFIIFPNKVFKVNRTNSEEYKSVVSYGISLDIPRYQLDFSPEIKYWER